MKDPFNLVAVDRSTLLFLKPVEWSRFDLNNVLNFAGRGMDLLIEKCTNHGWTASQVAALEEPGRAQGDLAHPPTPKTLLIHTSSPHVSKGHLGHDV